MGRPASEHTALWVLRALRDAGYQALFAGGCVRDRLLGRPCKDYDVATDATPKQVRKLFPHVLLVGEQFGVAMVMHHGEMVEVATFRSDESYSDGRRPDRVTFASPQDDAMRRDFTINGMFYDPIAEEVIDYVDGQKDLVAGVVRTIGFPEQRFGEDYLRLIRAVRFASRLGFQMEAETEKAIVRHADRIAAVSGERILDELQKMLTHASALRGLTELHRLGLIQHILPELFEPPELWQAALRRADGVAQYADATLTLTALLAGLDRAAIGRIVRRWGAANELRDTILWIARHLDDWRHAPEWPLCRFKRLITHHHFNHLCLLWLTVEQLETGNTDCHQRFRERLHSITPGQIAPAPFVSGDDLLEMGLPEGPELGRILDELYDAQLNEELSDRQAAQVEARRLVAEFNAARA